MTEQASAPWHKASYDRTLEVTLPELLAERLPLVGYEVHVEDKRTSRITITLASKLGEVRLGFAGLSTPDDAGVFEIEKTAHVVVPLASSSDLATAEIKCVGEQLYDYLQERVNEAPVDLPWDETMARAWLPLNNWVQSFLHERAQRLDETNWLSWHTHLRRIIVPRPETVIDPGQFGRVCPFEMPEGPNLGRVFSVASGAEIRDGRLQIRDSHPQSTLGLSASMIPFLEHNDPNRSLMGANMLRQWIVPPDPEPAWVQTGTEPDAPRFWAGRNLLTALISWGADTYEDGIVMSESAAGRFTVPHPVEVGDKFSNRHGTKGVISRILPDEEMPLLPDGRAVELIYNFGGLHVRNNFGQVREAVMGRIAEAEGGPVIVPPYGAPSAEEIRRRLAAAGLPESGMETLTMGSGGRLLKRPSCVGWVYWGRTSHLARNKVRHFIQGPGGQVQGELENYTLMELEAWENLAENVNTRSSRRPDADTLTARATAGPVEPADSPTPLLADLQERLTVAGIKAKVEEDGLRFSWCSPNGERLALAQPVPHPWLPERELSEVGVYTELEEYELLVEANERLARTVANRTPERLMIKAREQVAARVKTLFDALLAPQHLRFRERLLFSGRAVITPGRDLRLDQVGLAEEIAWTLFGPLVVRELGEAEEVEARSERAKKVLDRVMARSWLIINRAPTLSPTALLAFRPVREAAPVIRIHPLICEWLDADFDGDQVAIMLPLTAGAQAEAGERLTVAAHLARDPELLDALLPQREALWGLAELSRSAEGRSEIARLAGREIAAPNGFVTQQTLARAMRSMLANDGVEATLATLEVLMRRGFEVARESGASLSPFAGESFASPPTPEGKDADLWEAHGEAITEAILSQTDYGDGELGPQVLGVKIRERGLQHLAWLIGPRGVVADAAGQPFVVRRSFAKGLTPEEMNACVAGARLGLAGYLRRWEQLGQDRRQRHRPAGLHVLARARRSSRPGIVFARAAAAGETDPLVDVDARVLVGLPVGER